MLNVNEYVTTVEKKPYPWLGQIKDIMIQNGITYYKCWMTDQSGDVIRKIYTKSDIRHYSAKEMANDVFSHYSGEEKPVIENIYSKKYTDWLINKIAELIKRTEEIENAERTIVDPDFNNYTSAELAALEHMGEYSNCLLELHNMIQYELAEMSVVNEDTWIITVNNSDVSGLEMYRFLGTKKDAREQIQKFAEKIQEYDPKNFDGTSEIEEYDENEMIMVVNFVDCHVEIEARRIESIPALEE